MSRKTADRRSAFPSVGDQAIAGELGRRLDERGVGRRDDHVGALELLGVDQASLGPHERQQLLEALVKGVLVARLDRLDDGVVEVVEAVGLLVGEVVLALGRDPDDHAWPSCCLPCSSAGVSAPPPSPSSAFIFARSSSTWLCEVSSCSWRSMSSWPPPSRRLSSNAPAA